MAREHIPDDLTAGCYSGVGAFGSDLEVLMRLTVARVLARPVFAFLALWALVVPVNTSPTAPIAPTAATSTEPIGYVGCSNTWMIVQGYHALGGSTLWPVLHYGGGSVEAWASDSGARFWSEFSSQQAKTPATKFWLNMCSISKYSADFEYRAAVRVINEIHSRVPGSTVYVSGLNGYVSPHVCSIAGAEIPARTDLLADRLTAEGFTLRGPQMGSLMSIYQTPSDGATAENNQTLSDGCHPNTPGRTFLAQDLISFFG